MSVGLMCDCPLPSMPNLSPNDYGHRTRPSGQAGCPQYAADQERGGRCQFCADAEDIGHAYRLSLGIGKGFGDIQRPLSDGGESPQCNHGRTEKQACRQCREEDEREIDRLSDGGES